MAASPDSVVTEGEIGVAREKLTIAPIPPVTLEFIEHVRWVSTGGEAGGAKRAGRRCPMPARDDRPPREPTPRDSNLSEMRFLTVAEVATLMRVSRMTVYRLVHSGELPAVRVGRSFRVPERAVHDYLRTAFNDVG